MSRLKGTRSPSQTLVASLGSLDLLVTAAGNGSHLVLGPTCSPSTSSTPGSPRPRPLGRRGRLRPTCGRSRPWQPLRGGRRAGDLFPFAVLVSLGLVGEADRVGRPPGETADASLGMTPCLLPGCGHCGGLCSASVGAGLKSGPAGRRVVYACCVPCSGDERSAVSGAAGPPVPPAHAVGRCSQARGWRRGRSQARRRGHSLTRCPPVRGRSDTSDVSPWRAASRCAPPSVRAVDHPDPGPARAF